MTAPSAAPPPFPGATLAIDPLGQIIGAWLGPASPVGATSGDAFEVLELDDSSPDAARLQLLLASACGAPEDAWAVISTDAPRRLPRRDGSVLSVMWQPIITDGQVVGVTAFAVVGATTEHADDDPVELGRICVEALALLDECDASLRHLEAEPSSRQAVHRMFRAIHTIKGATRGTSMRAVADAAHQLEEALHALRCSDEEAAPTALAHLARELRQLRAGVVAGRPRGEVDDAMTELGAEFRPMLSELRALAPRLASGDLEALAGAARVVDRITDGAERGRLRALRVQCAAARNAIRMLVETPEDGEADWSMLDEVAALQAQIELYVAVHREVASTDAGPSTLVTLMSWLDAPEDRSESYDELIDVATRAGVPSLVDAFRASDPYANRRALAVLTDAQAMFEPPRPRDDATLRFERAQRDLLAALDTLARDLPATRLADARAIVQRLVWVPLAVHARRLVRMTRNLGAELGKSVECEIDLGDLLVAPEIGRVIGEVLVHAVRNAADHGIERPADRAASGKDAAGTIRVIARSERDRVVLLVEDDGGGIPVERVRDRAIAQGLITPTAAASANDVEILELLFVPGFSTASAVTAISGRGVGMDVVKSLVEEYGGHVTLTSTRGAGTRLHIDLPLSPP